MPTERGMNQKEAGLSATAIICATILCLVMFNCAGDQLIRNDVLNCQEKGGSVEQCSKSMGLTE